MALNQATVWDVGSEQYHADLSLSQSALKMFMSEPEKYFAVYVSQAESKPTRSQKFGLDFEELVLHNQLPGVLIPNEVLARSERDGKVILSRRGPEWRAWQQWAQETYGPDAELMRQAEWDERITPILQARDQLRAHDRAQRLIFGEGRPHIALRWIDEITGLPCRCQLDVLHGPDGRPRAIVDLKTAADAEPFAFRRAVRKFGYHIQAYWYRKAVERWLGVRLPFVFVVVKNKPGYRCETYQLEEPWFRWAGQLVEDALMRLAEAYLHNRWVSPTHGKIVMLPLPDFWTLNEEL